MNFIPAVEDNEKKETQGYKKAVFYFGLIL